MKKSVIKGGRLIAFLYSLYFVVLAASVFGYAFHLVNSTDTTDLVLPVLPILFACFYYGAFLLWSIRLFVVNKGIKEIRFSILVITICGIGTSLYFLYRLFFE